ncbi:MAG: phosphoenolpyruvate--protein phosphotransferase, partial [Longimicrobiales bacterium]
MSVVLDGSPASEGIVAGPVFVLEWGLPLVAHQSISDDLIATEIDRFDEARRWAMERLTELKEQTEARLGHVEGRIFDPQLLMLEDVEVVDGTARYIRENRLSAARAFELRMLELRAMWSRTSHPMVLDRLNDLEDLMTRVLRRLLGLNDPSDLGDIDEPVIVVAPNLTPSLIVQLDLENVLGIATDHGTRTAHWVMLARSLGIPAAVGFGDASTRARGGVPAILDGRIGRLVLEPVDDERAVFEARRKQHSEWEEEIAMIAALESVTQDGQYVELRGNLDLPGEAEAARAHGAVGVGLFRTEFLVVGRSSMPNEEEQYEAYRDVAEAFPSGAVYIRTFDLGGDKFPMFLNMPQEENPFLGWRAIRVCLDEPDLFRTQLRALLRATAHGDVRLMIPLVNDVEEIRDVRALLQEEADG